MGHAKIWRGNPQCFLSLIVPARLFAHRNWKIISYYKGLTFSIYGKLFNFLKFEFEVLLIRFSFKKGRKRVQSPVELLFKKKKDWAYFWSEFPIENGTIGRRTLQTFHLYVVLSLKDILWPYRCPESWVTIENWSENQESFVFGRSAMIIYWLNLEYIDFMYQF